MPRGISRFLSGSRRRVIRARISPKPFSAVIGGGGIDPLSSSALPAATLLVIATDVSPGSFCICLVDFWGMLQTVVLRGLFEQKHSGLSLSLPVCHVIQPAVQSTTDAAQ